MRYFIGRLGRQLGPFTESEVREKIATGLIGPDDLAWREGMADWQPVRTVFHDSAASPPPPPFGQNHPADFSPFRPAHTAPAAPEEFMLAGRGTRLGAVLLDGLVNLVATGPGLVWLVLTLVALSGQGALPNVESGSPDPETILNLVPQLAGPLLAVLVPLLVLVIMQVWLLTTRGQTLGKMWLKIRIVRTDGSPPGFVHAILLRSLVMQLIGMVPIVGGLVTVVDPLLIFREDRRCMHDLIAGTNVIKA